MFKELEDLQLAGVNRINELFAKIVTMEERINLNKALAVVIFKRLDNDCKLDKGDILRRMGTYTEVIDNIREYINIDAEIMKKAFTEYDTVLFNKDWSSIYDGEPLYPSYPESALGYRSTVINFVLNSLPAILGTRDE